MTGLLSALTPNKSESLPSTLTFTGIQNPASTSFEKLITPVTEDFSQLNITIYAQLRSRIPLIEQMAEYIISGGGKRLRPLVTLLCAHLCTENSTNSTAEAIENRRAIFAQQHQVQMATAIEFLHTATLLHDDVVDQSHLRRGKVSAHLIWDSPTSILVGDFLYSRAFQLLVSLGHLGIQQTIADATNHIAEGEVLQLINQHNIDFSETSYYEMIQYKTATIFQAAAVCGAQLVNASTEQIQELSNFANHLGCAFQMIDDLLDYQGNAQQLGKNIGDDLAEGKVTLPLIYALQTASDNERQIITEAIRTPRPDAINVVLPIIQSTGALARTQARAEQEAQLALQCLKSFTDNRYKTALQELLNSAVFRQH